MRSKGRAERWVVKAGSQMVCSGGPLLLRAWMQQVALLKRRRIEIIWVTSGAISSAVDRTGITRNHRSIAEKQALSAVGQPLVMDLYNLALQAVGCLGAQVLLTYDDVRHPVRCKNLKNTLSQLLKWGAVPVLNENDAVSTEEIQFGDNDSLSAKVAGLMGADRLVILTDVAGLFDKDPRKNPGARLIHELPAVTAPTLRTAGGGAGTGRGTGGMLTKLMAAREAAAKGIETWLVKGDRPDVLLEVRERRAVGTVIGGKRSKG